ncbi:fumarylacetoacetate hydrolase family protein [uncultured Parasphingorhabdus sp.]|uniref:2-keto-4-pentenoate hydratase n=1 Tax=uncultured Parasphingorhabdus sp. TaxID=2709694 RepID=UPI0030D81D86
MIDHKFHAAKLRNAYAGRAIAPLRHSEPQASEDDAYAIQVLNRDHWVQEGRRIVGAKIGLTSKAVQQQLGVDQPDFGVLFADMQVGDDGTIAPGKLLQPKVEAEIAFRLSHDIDSVADDPSTLADAISCAFPALEIVDSRIAEWDITFVDTVADNASAGMFILGDQPFDLQDLDLVGCAMRMEKNGVVASEGSGAACLGNPLNALAWLAAIRIGQGQPLKAGDIILSGALGPMVPAVSGDIFTAHIEGMGSVSLRLL